ncbi:MAG: hypothetical protein J0M20_01420 [Burkholderiales bacterium]|nr:hypothetical protein [Burkholderiales bacterium]
MPPQLAKEVHGLRAELAVKTPQEIIAELRNSGVSIAGWARANGFQREIVAQVLAGKLKGVHGEAHAVAVALGMKQGRPRQAADIRFTEAD